jgi:hypothetical protein
MPRTFDKPDPHENSVRSNSTMGFTAVCWILLIGFVALVANFPAVSIWISEGAQAEFALSTMTLDTPPAPVQIAAGKVR